MKLLLKTRPYERKKGSAIPLTARNSQPSPASLPALAWPIGFIFCVGYFLPRWWSPLGLAAYLVFVLLAERRRCAELGGGFVGLGQFLVGVPIGAALVVIPLAGHGLDLVAGGALVIGALAALSPLVEEPLMRGLVMRYLELALGSAWALIVTSALATLLHFALGSHTALQLTGIGLGMVAYGAAYLLTRRLWLPLGLHMSYNATVACLGADLSSVRWLVFLGLKAAVALTLVLLAWRAGAFVSSNEAWRAQTSIGRAATARELGLTSAST